MRRWLALTLAVLPLSAGAVMRHISDANLSDTTEAALNVNYSYINRELDARVSKTRTETIHGQKTFVDKGVFQDGISVSSGSYLQAVFQGASSTNSGGIALHGMGASAVDQKYEIQAVPQNGTPAGAFVVYDRTDSRYALTVDTNGEVKDEHGFLVPIGSLVMYGAASAPDGWLLCNGAAVSRTTYAALYTAIGTTYGSGDGSTTFNLPDFRGVFPKGAGTTTRAAGVDANGGYYSATLGAYAQDQLQGHDHPFYTTASAYAAGDNAPYRGGNTGDLLHTDAEGSMVTDGSHGTPRVATTTEPQSLGITFIIKY